MRLRHLAVVIPLITFGASATASAQSAKERLPESGLVEGMKPVHAPTLSPKIESDALHLPLPKHRNRLTFGSEEYNSHYAVQIRDLGLAIDDAKKGDFKRFEDALGLLSNYLVSPSGTEQTCDIMFEMIYLLHTKGLVNFSGTKAQWGNEERTFTSVDQIAEASKSDEGRTWLTGIVQNWMFDMVPALHSKGYMSVVQAAEILVYARKDVKYDRGRFLEAQTQFLSELSAAMKSGDPAQLEAVIAKARNPIDHTDVDMRTHGKGWKAFGKTTIRYFMLVVEEVKRAETPPPPPPPKPIELPIHKQVDPVKVEPINGIAMTSVATRLIHKDSGVPYTPDEIKALEETHSITYIWISYRTIRLNDGNTAIMIVDPSLPEASSETGPYVPYNSFLGADGKVYLLDKEKFIKGFTGKGPSPPQPKIDESGAPIVLGNLSVEGGKISLTAEAVASSGIRDNCIQTNLTPDAVFRTAIFRGAAGSLDLSSQQIFSAFIYLMERKRTDQVPVGTD